MVFYARVRGHTRHHKERSRSAGEQDTIQVRPGSGTARIEPEGKVSLAASGGPFREVNLPLREKQLECSRYRRVQERWLSRTGRSLTRETRLREGSSFQEVQLKFSLAASFYRTHTPCYSLPISLSRGVAPSLSG
jgi:hypothetical protein